MKTFVSKLGDMAKVVSMQRGKFTLFALVLPDDTFAWDILVAAEWINHDKKEALHYLVERVQRTLTKDEILDISGIVLLDNDEFEGAFSSMESDTGWEENDTDFLGRHIQKGFVFAAPLEDSQVQVSR